jgi:proline iminopeptidase
MIRRAIQIFIVIFAFQACQPEEPKRETVLDNISHLEDSIFYQIPELPMLCDELGMERQFVDIGDCKLYCEIEGQGVPMVLVNGGPGGTHHYFHPWFKQAIEFCRVIYYDQRGCGQSDFEKGEGYTFTQAINDLDNLRQKLGIEKWVVCGYSYGGALAQYYATAYPEHVLGMVLISSSTLLHDKILDDTRQNDFISKEEKQRINELYDLYHKDSLNLVQLLFNKDLNGDWKRQNFLKPTKEEVIRTAMYEWVNDKGFNPEMGANYGAFDFKHVFDSCPIPTLLCEGKWDLTWLPEKAELFHKNHPNAQYLLFEESGHNIYMDEPKLFFATLENFIEGLEEPTSVELEKWNQETDRILGSQLFLFENEKKFFALINNEGIEKASAYYEDFKQIHPNAFLFSENGLNMLGYNYLWKKDYDGAIALFQMNVDAYPDSWNVYDSLGEALLERGDKEKAKENYQKSIQLNPENKAGKKVLDQINTE